MTHAQFVEAYRAGRIRVTVDPAAAARFVSQRLLLPFFAIPVIGVGIALCLTGRYAWGGLLMATGIIGPKLIKRSAPRFVLAQSLADPAFHADALAAGVLAVAEEDGGPDRPGA